MNAKVGWPVIGGIVLFIWVLIWTCTGADNADSNDLQGQGNTPPPAGQATATPALEWVWITQSTSCRALWTALWMTNPARLMPATVLSYIWSRSASVLTVSKP